MWVPLINNSRAKPAAAFKNPFFLKVSPLSLHQCYIHRHYYAAAAIKPLVRRTCKSFLTLLLPKVDLCTSFRTISSYFSIVCVLSLDEERQVLTPFDLSRSNERQFLSNYTEWFVAHLEYFCSYFKSYIKMKKLFWLDFLFQTWNRAFV